MDAFDRVTGPCAQLLTSEIADARNNRFIFDFVAIIWLMVKVTGGIM